MAVKIVLEHEDVSLRKRVFERIKALQLELNEYLSILISPYTSEEEAEELEYLIHRAERQLRYYDELYVTLR
jgi:hypothetical protein